MALIVLGIGVLAGCDPEAPAEDVSATVAVALAATQTTEAEINLAVETAVAAQLPTETATITSMPTAAATIVHPTGTATNTPDPGPLIRILSPLSGQEARVGEALAVQVEIEDAANVSKVSILVDDEYLDFAFSPNERVVISETWMPFEAGSASLIVYAANENGVATESEMVTFAVEEAPPTNTPRPAPSSTPLPEMTQSAGSLQAVVAISSANLREGPGTEFESTAVLTDGATLTLIARTSNGNWFNVRIDSRSTGWIAASVVDLAEGSSSAVEVAATIPAPPAASSASGSNPGASRSTNSVQQSGSCAPPDPGGPANDRELGLRTGNLFFTWSYGCKLGANEYFDLRFWREGEPHYGITWTKETHHWLSPPDPGKYCWSVAVLRGKDGKLEAEVTGEATPNCFTVLPR